jgi:hypothetical protein
MPGVCAKRAFRRALAGALAAACLAVPACRPPRIAEDAPEATPALVVSEAAPCETSASRGCPPPTRFTVLLVNPQGFTAPESLQVALEPRADRDVPSWEERVRRGRFVAVSPPTRAAAAFESLDPGLYRVRVGRPGGESSLWRVVIVRGCWSRLEIWMDPRAQVDAVAPGGATLYSCGVTGLTSGRE